MNNDAIFQAYLLVFGNTVAMLLLMTVLVVWLNYRRRKKLLDVIEVVVTAFNDGIEEKKNKIRPWVQSRFSLSESELDEEVERLIKAEKAFYQTTFSTIITKNLDSIKNYPEVIDEFLNHYTKNFSGHNQEEEVDENLSKPDNSQTQAEQEPEQVVESVTSEPEQPLDDEETAEEGAAPLEVSEEDVSLDVEGVASEQDETSDPENADNVSYVDEPEAIIATEEPALEEALPEEVADATEDIQTLLDEVAVDLSDDETAEAVTESNTEEQDDLAAALEKTKQALKAATDKKAQESGGT